MGSLFLSYMVVPIFYWFNYPLHTKVYELISNQTWVLSLTSNCLPHCIELIHNTLFNDGKMIYL